MRVFLLIIFGIPVLDIAWWLWADSRLRHIGAAKRWRVLLAAFVGVNLAVYAWLLLSRMHDFPVQAPAVLLGLCYIWHLTILPATILLLAGGGLARAFFAGIWRPMLRILAKPAPAALPEASENRDESSDDTITPGLTRREMLTAAMIATPPVAAALGEVRALTQLEAFRIRNLELALPTLPAALDGLTIAHLSDLHVGRFTNGNVLDEIVRRTNALGSDLVLFTGDLIDHDLADLPAGTDLLNRLTPREGLYVCEGNHDLFEGRREFEQGVRNAGLRLLLNESETLNIRGEAVQILGLSWGSSETGRGPSIERQMASLTPMRNPSAFGILLAHHPHAFDLAEEAGIPLTLAGHTHGGQLMLSEGVGAGPLLFKYWSGLYQKRDAALVVSNGVGNWFPLRINAPAEIVHLTLKTAPEL